MRVIAIVEVPGEEHGPLRTTLLQAAYVASRRGPVAVLAPIAARDVLDRELDPVVAVDSHVHGVLYGESDDSWVWRAATPGTLVVAFTALTRARARAAGVACVDVTEGLSALQSLGAHAAASDALDAAVAFSSKGREPGVLRVATDNSTIASHPQC